MEVIERCRPHIEAALEYAGGTHLPGDVIRSVLSGQLQLWPGEKSAIVTEIEHYPQTKNCHLFLAGGDIGELQKMLVDVERWAAAQGCSRITLAGRKGWLRSFLVDDGYQAKFVGMAKELNGQG